MLACTQLSYQQKALALTLEWRKSADVYTNAAIANKVWQPFHLQSKVGEFQVPPM
jgi:hypothetical protein